MTLTATSRAPALKTPAAVVTSWALALCGAVALQFGASGQGQSPPVPQVPNPAFAAVQDDPTLPRVLLIGDSISIGYTLPARRLLERRATVHRIPVNGGPTVNGLEHLEQWLGRGPWNVIHFNWGLHDLRIMEDGRHQVTIDEYEKNLRILVERLKRTGATLIWASTTPVPDAAVNPPRRNGDVIAYNAVAMRIMQDNAIEIDDLYALALPRLGQLQRPANVHYTDAGYEVLAEHVAASIRRALDASR